MSFSKTFYPFLVLVQPRKTYPDMTKNVDWRVKNQNKHTINLYESFMIWHNLSIWTPCINTASFSVYKNKIIHLENILRYASLMKI